MNKLRILIVNLLRWSEKYAGTDMVYLTKSSFWLNLNTVAATIFSFVLSVAFARLLPKEAYGTYQFIISLGSMIGAVTLTGMNGAIIQSVARGFEGSFKKSVLTQLTWGVVPFLISVLISVYYFINDNVIISGSILIIGVLLPIINSFNTYTAFISGKKDFQRAFFYSQILNFSYYPLLIISLFFTNNPLYLIIVNFGTNAILSAILYKLTVRFYRPNSTEDTETISFGKHMSLANIFGTMVLQLDNILIFHFIGAAPLAIYAFASNIPDRFNGLFKSVVAAALPKFSEKTQEELQKNTLNKSVRFAILTLAGSVVYIILAPTFYKIFFPLYVSSASYSQAYSLVLVIGSLSSLPFTALIATKAKKEIYIYNLANPAFGAVIMTIGAIMFGIWGVIFARGISNIFSFLLLIFLIKQKSNNL